MKKTILITAITAGLLGLISLGNKPQYNEAIIGDPLPISITLSADEIGNLDMESSQFTWEGNKAIGSGHVGTIAIKPNSFLIGTTGKLTSGVILLDMNTITCTDLNAELAPKLEAHLKSSDFFNVEQFPLAWIEVIELNKTLPEENYLKGATHTAIGNLTVNNVVKSVQFPVIVHYQGNEVHVVGEVALDRTAFNVMYGSDESLKDKLIQKNVILKFKVNGTLDEDDPSGAVDAAVDAAD